MRRIPLRVSARIIFWNLVVSLIVAGALGWALEYRRFHRFDAQIAAAAQRYGVDPRLIRCVIWQESRFRPQSRSPRGALGLMQVMPASAQDWARIERRDPPTETDLYDVPTNLTVGTWCLARALRFWSDRGDALPYALAEYNAGRRNAQAWARDADSARTFYENIAFDETRRYVRNILRRYRGRVW